MPRQNRIQFHEHGLPPHRRRFWRQYHNKAEAWCFTGFDGIGTGARTLAPLVLLLFICGYAGIVYLVRLARPSVESPRNEAVPGANHALVGAVGVGMSWAIEVVIHVLTWLVVWSFVVSHRANNDVPHRWLPPRILQDRALLEQLDARNPPADWCRPCGKWKPPRAHHCSTCGKCSLKMDHHCVWVGNCIGLHNHKPFVLFITYLTLATAIAASCCLIFLYRLLAGYREECDAITCRIKSKVFLACCVELLLTGATSLLVGQLLSFQVSLLGQNLTTIEAAKIDSGRSPGQALDQGSFWANIESTLGPRSLHWLLPLPSTADDVVGAGVDPGIKR